MKSIQLATIAVFIVFCTQASAQTTSEQPQPASDDATQAVGGAMAPQTAMGGPAGKTRDQVYRELVQSQHNGDADHLKDLFKGGN